MNRLSFHPASPTLMRHIGAPLASASTEEVLDIHNIQGNIPAGFNKDHQALLFLKITDAASQTLAAIHRALDRLNGGGAELQSPLQSHVDLLENQGDGDDGHFNFEYLDAFGRPAQGRFPKGAKDFHPHVPEDPGVFSDHFQFGRDLANHPRLTSR